MSGIFNESGLPLFKQMNVSQRLKSIIAAGILLCIIGLILHSIWPKDLNRKTNLIRFLFATSAVLSLIYISDGGRMLSDHLGWIVA